MSTVVMQQEIKFKNLPDIPVGLWGLYQFEETAGLLAYNSNGLNPISSTSELWHASGKKGRCISSTSRYDDLKFDIDNSNNILTNDEMSFCFWFKKATTGTSSFIDRSAASGTRVLRIAIESGRYRILVGNYLGNWTFTQFTNVNQPSPGIWVHLAVTISRNRYELYENGELVATQDYPDNGGFVKESTEPFYVAGHALSSANGLMDELYIYRRILTVSEVKDIMILSNG